MPLQKGLRAFAVHDCPGFFEAADFEVNGLDAHISIHSELPGDFQNVESAYLAILPCAAHGYIDFFEEGNKVHRAYAAGPIKRWCVGPIDKKFKFVLREGQVGLAWPGVEIDLGVVGAFTFATPAVASKVAAALPLRLPYLAAEGVREVRIGPDVLRIEGKKLSVAVTVRAPEDVRELILEAMRAVSQVATTGKVTMHGGGHETTIEPGAKARTRETRGSAALPETVLTAVAAGAPEARGNNEAPVALESVVKPRKAGKAEAGPQALVGHGGPVAGARLAGDRVIVWGGRHVTVLDARTLEKLHAFDVSGGESFSWPIHEVVPYGEMRAVVLRESNGDLEFLDLAAGTCRTITRAHGHGVHGAVQVGDRLVTWSLDRTARSFTLEGEPDRVFNCGENVERLVVLPDHTFVTIAGDQAVQWDPRTGERLADLGPATGVYCLPDGRFLVEKYGEHHAVGGAPMAFDVDKGNYSEVALVNDEEVLIHSRSARSFSLLTLATGAMRTVQTAHTKQLARVARIDGDRWITHGRSMPGLNERFGFDGTLRVWQEGPWTELAAYDCKAPIARVVPLGGGRVALVLDDVIRGKELPIYDVNRLTVNVLQGWKKPIVGVLPVGNRLLVWTKDGKASVAG